MEALQWWCKKRCFNWERWESRDKKNEIKIQTLGQSEVYQRIYKFLGKNYKDKPSNSKYLHNQKTACIIDSACQMRNWAGKREIKGYS